MFCLISGSSFVYGQFRISVEFGLIYTFLSKKLISGSRMLDTRYSTDATNRIGLNVDRVVNENVFVGVTFAVDDYDFGMYNKYSVTSKGSFYSGGMSSGTHNEIYKFGGRLGYKINFTEKSMIEFVAMSIVFISMTREVDTNYMNAIIWNDYDYIQLAVTTDFVEQRVGPHAALGVSGKYERRFGKVFGLGLGLAYQQGFGYYRKFRYRYDNHKDIALIDHKLRGSGLQFLLSFNFYLPNKENVRYLSN